MCKLRWAPESKKEWEKEALLQEAKKLPPAYTDTVTSEYEAISHSSTASADDDFFDFEWTTATERPSAASKVIMECLRYLEEPCTDSLEVLIAPVSICEVSFPQDQCYCAIIGPS